MIRLLGKFLNKSITHALAVYNNIMLLYNEPHTYMYIQLSIIIWWVGKYVYVLSCRFIHVHVLYDFGIGCVSNFHTQKVMST